MNPRTTKMSIVPLLLLALVPTGSAESGDRYRKCKALCKDYFETKLNKMPCKPALNATPRPGVFNACVSGRVFGFDAACVPTCTGHGDEALKDANSYEECRREATKALPNNEFSWCRNGYDLTFSEIQTVVRELTAEWQFGDESSSPDAIATSENGAGGNIFIAPETVELEGKVKKEKTVYVPKKHREREHEEKKDKDVNNTLRSNKKSKEKTDGSKIAQDTIQGSQKKHKIEF